MRPAMPRKVPSDELVQALGWIGRTKVRHTGSVREED